TCQLIFLSVTRPYHKKFSCDDPLQQDFARTGPSLASSHAPVIIRHLRSMSGVTEMDWHAWHDDYDKPGTPLARRLAAVQDQIRVALDAAPPGPLHAISLCAGP